MNPIDIIKPVLLPIRYFIWQDDLSSQSGDYGDIYECTEQEFTAYKCDHITYVRHTVHANGVDQICLTKCPRF